MRLPCYFDEWYSKCTNKVKGMFPAPRGTGIPICAHRRPTGAAPGWAYLSFRLSPSGQNLKRAACFETGRPACGNPASLLRRGCDGRDLLSGMVDGIVAAVGSRQDDLGDRNKCVALLEQLFKNAGQGFRGVEGGVVEENDGSRLDLGSDPLRDLRRRKVLPVQAVTFPYRFKLLRSNNYFSLG